MSKTRSTLALFGAATVAAVLIALGGCTGSGTTPPPLVGTANPPPGPGSAALVVTDTGLGNGGRFLVFLPTDSGTTAPQAFVSGSNTQLGAAKAITRDARGNFYMGSNSEVADSSCGAPTTTRTPGKIVVFDRTATGNAFPAVVISGSNTTLDDSVAGIAVDSSGNIFVTQDDAVADADFCAPVPDRARILVFGPLGVSGDVAPASRIIGLSTKLVEPAQLTFAAGKLWVADEDTSVRGTKGVKAFNVTGLAAGDTDLAPAITITSASFSRPTGVAVDSSNNVYVADASNSAIYKFNNITSNCLACTPSKTIAGGTNTTLSRPFNVVTDGTFLYVSNENGGDVLVFGVNDNGDVAPTRTIFSSSPAFDEPTGLSL